MPLMLEFTGFACGFTVVYVKFPISARSGFGFHFLFLFDLFLGYGIGSPFVTVFFALSMLIRQQERSWL